MGRLRVNLKIADVIQRICAACGDIPVQIGGGIRTMDSADAYINAGIQWLIIGTLAVKNPEFVDELCQRHADHVIVGLDAKDGFVALKAGQKRRRSRHQFWRVDLKTWVSVRLSTQTSVVTA